MAAYLKLFTAFGASRVLVGRLKLNPTCAESTPDHRQIKALAEKLALHFWCGAGVRRCVRALAARVQRGACVWAGRCQGDREERPGRPLVGSRSANEFGRALRSAGRCRGTECV